MKNRIKNLKLTTLKLNSFVTKLNVDTIDSVKGGAARRTEYCGHCYSNDGVFCV